VLLRSVIGRGVVAIVRMLEPVIVNVNAHSKATFCPPVAAAVTWVSSLGIYTVVIKSDCNGVIFCI
jgi:hypothetical protein